MAATYQTVSRTRTELNIIGGPPSGSLPFVSVAVESENIPGASPRMQKWFHSASINLAPKAIDIDLDQIRKGIELFVPHMLRDFSAAHDSAGVARHKLHECILLGRHR